MYLLLRPYCFELHQTIQQLHNCEKRSENSNYLILTIFDHSHASRKDNFYKYIKSSI